MPIERRLRETLDRTARKIAAVSSELFASNFVWREASDYAVITMPRADEDMRRMSHLLAEGQEIAARRGWEVLALYLDKAQAVLLNVEPGGGETGTVEFRPTPHRQKLDQDE